MNGREHESPALSLVKDPVCGMGVDPATSQLHARYDHRTYYFCSTGCQARFTAEPTTFASTSGTAAGHGPALAASDSESTEWTCPMHPEIRRRGPGSCPICGMALEPVMVSADDGPSPELRDMAR